MACGDLGQRPAPRSCARLLEVPPGGPVVSSSDDGPPHPRGKGRAPSVVPGLMGREVSVEGEEANFDSGRAARSSSGGGAWTSCTGGLGSRCRAGTRPARHPFVPFRSSAVKLVDQPQLSTCPVVPTMEKPGGDDQSQGLSVTLICASLGMISKGLSGVSRGAMGESAFSRDRLFSSS